MALDGIYLYSVVAELQQKILGCKIDKVNQPENDEVILTIRGDGKNYKLLISASPVYPKIHLYSGNKKNPITAPMFCMVLRKYLLGSTITKINQVSTDRIVEISVESTDEMGFNSIYTLVVEIMGRHSNISLIRQRDNIIMDSIKHVTPDINTYRSLLPGITFVYPPSSTKMNPFSFTKDEFSKALRELGTEIDKNTFLKLFTGVSRQFSNEIYNNFINQNSYNIFEYLNKIFNDIKLKKFCFCIYSDGNTLKDFYCCSMNTLQHYNSKIYDNGSLLLEDFYAEKDKQDRLAGKSSNILKLLNTNYERCAKKLNILNETLKECSKKDFYKIQGELLTANIYSIEKGMSSVQVLNYYNSNEQEYVDIKLDENKTPSENIQSMFKKYNKLKKSEEAANIQIKADNDEIEYISSVITSVKNADNYLEIEEIRKELVETGYIKKKKEDKKKVKPSKPDHYISSDGFHIYVGKNNYQNDYLTLKFADKNDIWLHTKNIPGSHVIIKNTGNVSDSTLEEAALLAGYFSKGRNSSKVPVDYTIVKNVKKPSGAKPGMVIYYTNKTIYVTPVKPEIEKVIF